MGEELTLAASYALAEKHALWDEAKQSNKNESEKKHMEHFPTREDSAPETFTKFTVPISQILRELKNEPWFELPLPMKGDLPGWIIQSIAHSIKDRATLLTAA